MNVVYELCKVAVCLYGSPFKGPHKKGALSLAVNIKGLGIGIKKITECFCEAGGLRFIGCIIIKFFDPQQEMKMIWQEAVTIYISDRGDMFYKFLQEVPVILIIQE